MKPVHQETTKRPRPISPAQDGNSRHPRHDGASGANYGALLALVFCSGFAALIYELLWFRQLGLVFGNTVQAAATVLTAFMAGLAAGAYGARQWVARLRQPVLCFGVLEAGIGLYALIVPAAFAGVSAAYKALATDTASGSVVLTGLRFLLALLVLFVPTALMGASLPVLSEAALRTRERFATRLGFLYGANTAGATLGVLACGFLLIPEWGVKATNLVAAVINVLIGLLAFLLARRSRAAAPSALAGIEEGSIATQTSRPGPGAGSLLLAVAGLCGFLALAFETVWFRALVLVFGSTSHSFSIMVGCFLLGLVAGSAALGRLAEQSGRAPWVLAVSLVGTGIWTLVSLLAYPAAPVYFLESLIHFDFSYPGMLVTKAATASVFLLPLAIFSGLAFTAVVRLIRDRTASSGQAVGAAFSVNALGSAAGAALGGFVLLPACGLERSLQILGGAAILLGLVVLWRSVTNPKRQRVVFLVLTVAVAAGLFALTPQWDRLLLCSGPYFTPRTHVQGNQVKLRDNLASLELLFYHEGTTATVSVTRSLDGRLHFSSDGKTEADTSPQSMVLQRMMGHLPMLLHPNPRRALNIGMGAGVTSGALSCYPDVKIDIADIELAVTNVAAIWAERNHDLIKRANFTLFINDGRNHLLVTTNRYDVITSDPFEPVVAGAASLYTLEHFKLARSRLAQGGMMAQFLPLYELSREDVLMIWRTFTTVFPRSSMFFTGTDTVLVGYTGDAGLDLAAVAAKFRIPEVKASLAGIGIDRPAGLLDMLVMELEPAGGAVEPGTLNTDDRPHIEYSAQRSALEYRTDANQQVLLKHFNEIPPRHLAGLAPEVVAEVTRERDAFRTMLRASILRSQGDVRGTVDLLRLATENAPRSPIIRNELLTSLGLLARQGDKDQARTLYQEALKVDPKDFSALYNLHLLSRADQQLELAADYLRQGLEAYPDSAMFLAMRGRQSGMAGDVKAACRDLAAALQLLPRRADFWNIYADFLQRDGQAAEAETARSKARRLGAK